MAARPIVVGMALVITSSGGVVGPPVEVVVEPARGLDDPVQGRIRRCSGIGVHVLVEYRLQRRLVAPREDSQHADHLDRDLHGHVMHEVETLGSRRVQDFAAELADLRLEPVYGSRRGYDTLKWNASSRTLTVVSRNGRHMSPPPAQLTRESRPPSSLTVRSTRSGSRASSAMSAGRVSACARLHESPRRRPRAVRQCARSVRRRRRLPRSSERCLLQCPGPLR
jgi:hypothetical protein